MSAVRAGEPNAGAPSASEQGLILALRGAVRRCASPTRLAAEPPCILHLVIEALADEDYVGDTEIDCESYGGGSKMCPNGA